MRKGEIVVCIKEYHWYENDNLNFNGSYDRHMYNQLIVSLREEKFKKIRYIDLYLLSLYSLKKHYEHYRIKKFI